MDAWRQASPARDATVRGDPRHRRLLRDGYAPIGRSFTVRMSAINTRVHAWWFNARTGHAASIGTLPNTGEREFTPPDPGEMLDWVLVLDDAAKGYSPPGQRLPERGAGPL